MCIGENPCRCPEFDGSNLNQRCTKRDVIDSVIDSERPGAPADRMLSLPLILKFFQSPVFASNQNTSFYRLYYESSIYTDRKARFASLPSALETLTP